jgi:hypothetical protein
MILCCGPKGPAEGQRQLIAYIVLVVVACILWLTGAALMLDFYLEIVGVLDEECAAFKDQNQQFSAADVQQQCDIQSQIILGIVGWIIWPAVVVNMLSLIFGVVCCVYAGQSKGAIDAQARVEVASPPTYPGVVQAQVVAQP